MAELLPVRQSFAKAYFLTCDWAGVKQGIKASKREVFRIGCNSEAGTCCTGPSFWQAWHPLVYFMKSDKNMVWYFTLISQLILCPAWCDPHTILHHGLETTFFLTHTPEDQYVLSTPIQYSVNQSIIQSLFFSKISSLSSKLWIRGIGKRKRKSHGAHIWLLSTSPMAKMDWPTHLLNILHLERYYLIQRDFQAELGLDFGWAMVSLIRFWDDVWPRHSPQRCMP